MPKVATISVYVADMSQAIDFYSKQLGFQVAAKPNPYITVLKNDGPVIVLCQAENQHRHNYPTESGTVYLSPRAFPTAVTGQCAIHPETSSN